MTKITEAPRYVHQLRFGEKAPKEIRFVRGNALIRFDWLDFRSRKTIRHTAVTQDEVPVERLDYKVRHLAGVKSLDDFSATTKRGAIRPYPKGAVFGAHASDIK